MADAESADATGDAATAPADAESMISDPAGVIRVANMLQALVVEVRDMELDEAGRGRLFEIQRNAVDELKGILSDDLGDELQDLGLPIEEPDATGPELRIAQSQLVGWLNGLFQGIQAAVMAQQAGSAKQLQQLRRPEQGAPPQGQYL